jgi:hypothetical protein
MKDLYPNDWSKLAGFFHAPPADLDEALEVTLPEFLDFGLHVPAVAHAFRIWLELLLFKFPASRDRIVRWTSSIERELGHTPRDPSQFANLNFSLVRQLLREIPTAERAARANPGGRN